MSIILNNKSIYFSIIIPTFNSEKYIDKCINSLHSQIFTSFEILILDSFSTDKTLTILQQRKYANLEIRIIKKKDLGIYDAMNNGINIANGKWLYFLGSDDYLFDNFVLRDIFNYTNFARNIDVVYGNVFFERTGKFYDHEFDFHKLFLKNICHQGIFYKRNVFDIVGKYSLNYPFLSDYEHNLRWFFNKKIKVNYLERTIAFYADGGFSARFIDEKFNLFKKKYFMYKFIKIDPLISIDLLNHLISHYKKNNSIFIFYYYRFVRFLLKKYSNSHLFVS